MCESASSDPSHVTVGSALVDVRDSSQGQTWSNVISRLPSLLEDNALSPMLPKLVRPWRFPLARAAAVPIKPGSSVKEPGRDYRGHRYGRAP
ncbi:hypothetical protein KOW79_020465 [Hemibagrus wyckioides]|uniref:Uncharacterized protein n=1 Tax=Hemibagrus wyckioides TaxID=337641 RepID=A0A9D3N6E9_9TELE|nr:hypothetical protein KOW79_020465 [Hemibagrus wyckioides]